MSATHLKGLATIIVQLLKNTCDEVYEKETPHKHLRIGLLLLSRIQRAGQLSVLS
jgi:hypothetical protein